MSISTTDFYQILENRRSIRPGEFEPTQLDRSTIDRLIHAANQAPSHRKLYPWRFIVFDTDEAKTKLGEHMAAKQAEHSSNPVPEVKLNITKRRPTQCSCVIAIVMNPDTEKLPYWEEVAATASAVQNMWLAITAEGLGGYWSSPGSIIKNSSEFLNLNEQEECLGFMLIGKPTVEPKPIERPEAPSKVRYF